MTTDQSEHDAVEAEVVEPEVLSRVSQQWPADLKERVTEKVGKRGLTEFTVLAIRRQLDDGGADLAVEGRDARDLAQRALNILATVVDREQRLNALANMALPDWVNTKIWPDEVLERINATVETDMHEESAPGTASEIKQVNSRDMRAASDDIPELSKVQGEVTTVRVEEPKRRDDDALGSPDEPVVIPEGRVNAMDGIRYSTYQHIHSPEGKCLKNVFVEADADGLKHCPLVAAIPQEKITELAGHPNPPQRTPDGTLVQPAGPDNLFERLKASGALKPAADLPIPEKPPVEGVPHAPAPPVGDAGQQVAAPSTGLPTAAEVEAAHPALDDVDGDLAEQEEILQEEILRERADMIIESETSGPESGPATPEAGTDPSQAGQNCPNGCGPLDGGLCWTCGFAA